MVWSNCHRRRGSTETAASDPSLTSASDPREPFALPIHAVRELSLQLIPVGRGKESSQWNELIERYHPLRYTPLPGAQLRYLAFSGAHLLAALGFGAAAWSLAPRDRFIGWSTEERTRNLHRVVNNARFLIPPWVRSQNLASRLLAEVAKRLPRDWEARYGFRPVLLGVLSASVYEPAAPDAYGGPACQAQAIAGWGAG